MKYKHQNACPMSPKKLQQVINDPNYKKQEKFKGIRCFLIVSLTGSKLYTRGENCVGHMIFGTTLPITRKTSSAWS